MAGWTCTDNETNIWDGSIEARHVIKSSVGLFSDKVGIGTTTPTQPLEINTGTYSLGFAGETITFNRPSANYIRCASGAGYMAFIVNGNSQTVASSALYLQVNNNATFAGNVGIGIGQTATPTYQLDVSGSIGLKNNGDAINMIRNTGSAVVDVMKISSGTDILTLKMPPASAGNIGFQIVDTGNIPILSLYREGNLGVGVTNPSSNLHVSGALSGLYAANIAQYGTNGYGLLVQTAGNAIDEPALNVTTTTGTNLLYVAPTGKVGIGISSPLSSLHIAGAMGFNNTPTPTTTGCSGALFVSGACLYFISGAIAHKISIL